MDYGIVISDKGSDVNKLENVLYTTKYPVIKLDTANPISFRNIMFKFVNNPPVGTTVVAKLPHGYTYTPSFWSLVNILLPVPTNFKQDYFQESGVLSLTVTLDSNEFSVSADEENIYFTVVKTVSGGTPDSLVGMILRIRLFVFVEDVGQ